jgi:predicted nucleic acid-binding protein
MLSANKHLLSLINGKLTDTARIHAEIQALLTKQGKLIGAHDLIIAATALTHSC